MSRTLTISLFNNKHDKHPRSQEVTWAQFCEMLAVRDIRPDKNGPAWSPVSYQTGSKRGNENVFEIHALALDLDCGCTPEFFRERWRGIAHYVYSTHSNTSETCKFRAVFPLLVPVAARDWPNTVKRLTFGLSMGLADESCKDASRIYFSPSVSENQQEQAFAYVCEGEWLVPESFPDISNEASVEESKGRPGDDFNRRSTWREILEPLGAVELPLKENHWVRPGKDPKDGHSACTGRGTGDLMYVFTNNWPPFEPSRLYSKFAAYALLNFGGDFSLAASELARHGYASAAPGSSDSRLLADTYVGSEKAGFQLTRLADLLNEPDEEMSWVVDRMLPSGGLSMLAAKPKAGKSTLARNLALSIARGEPFLGRESSPGLVLYFGLEEKRGEVSSHFRRMGADEEEILVHVGASPEHAMQALTEIVTRERPILVIVDPLFHLIRIGDANDYAQVLKALQPLMNLARGTGAHILVTHHMGKAERGEGDGVLGSTALYGAVDCLLEIRKRTDGRTVVTRQRYGEDLPETVLHLDPTSGTVVAAGTHEDSLMSQACEAIRLSLAQGGLTESDIRSAVEGNNRVVAAALRLMASDGKLDRSGGGKRNDPFVYTLKPTLIGNGSHDVCGSTSMGSAFAGDAAPASSCHVNATKLASEAPPTVVDKEEF